MEGVVALVRLERGPEGLDDFRVALTPVTLQICERSGGRKRKVRKTLTPVTLQDLRRTRGDKICKFDRTHNGQGEDVRDLKASLRNKKGGRNGHTGRRLAEEGSGIVFLFLSHLEGWQAGSACMSALRTRATPAPTQPPPARYQETPLICICTV